MKRFTSVLLLSIALVMIVSPFVLASEGSESSGNTEYYAMAVLGCGIAIGLAAFGTGIGQGIGLSKACEGVARNPEAAGKIQTTLIIGLALIESLAIYALVVVLIVLFMNPFKL